MPIYPYQGITPRIHPTAFIHPDAVVIGDVEIGPHSSVWPAAVVRGDVNIIRIGARSSVQDGSVVHVARRSEKHPDGAPTIIGDDIVVGHKVVLHGCRLEDGCMVGIGATVLDCSVIGAGAIVGAGALVTPRKSVAPGTLWLGSPAKQIKELGEAEQAGVRATAENYVRLAAEYLAADQ